MLSGLWHSGQRAGQCMTGQGRPPQGREEGTGASASPWRKTPKGTISCLCAHRLRFHRCPAVHRALTLGPGGDTQAPYHGGRDTSITCHESLWSTFEVRVHCLAGLAAGSFHRAGMGSHKGLREPLCESRRWGGGRVVTAGLRAWLWQLCANPPWPIKHWTFECS